MHRPHLHGMTYFAAVRVSQSLVTTINTTVLEYIDIYREEIYMYMRDIYGDTYTYRYMYIQIYIYIYYCTVVLTVVTSDCGSN